MNRIFSYIDKKQEKYEYHAFFVELLNNQSLSGEERLAWAPCTIPFIMSYADLNKYILRNKVEKNGGNNSTLQNMLNIHTYEEDFHWKWMLNDINRLGMNPKLMLTDAIQILWSPQMKASRQLFWELAAIASTAPIFTVYAMVEAVEAISFSLFKHCRGITLYDGKECEFFGEKHYIAEASHLSHQNKIEVKMPDLTEAQVAETITVIDRVFDLFEAWLGSLLRYAKENPASQLRDLHRRDALEYLDNQYAEIS